MRTTAPEWIVVTVAAMAFPAVPAAATDAGGALGPSRAELVHRWDLNKDGKLDESEAEVARAKMRRERLELQQKSATEKPLVPDGNGHEPPAKVEGDPLGEAFLPPKPTPPKAAESEPVKEPAKRSRDLNAGRSKEGILVTPNTPGMRGGGIQGGQAAGGVVTGGARAGAPALRPGYGASGPKVDLNAGRLPAGLPPAQGMRPQVGSAPFRPGSSGIGPARNQDRGIDPRGAASRPGPITPARPPLVPSSPARISAEDIGL